MSNNLLSFLSDKYCPIKVLGHGSNSTVYLVRHQFLELERALKVIPKTDSNQLSVLSEARLLKSLHHPCIPQIYDIEEDEHNFYLFEEYIKGDSLDAYLLHQQHISPNLFYSICQQLCDIYEYFHHLPEPLFYQDLKPEHIIVCGNRIYLIDLGVTKSFTNSGNISNYLGNKDFSAPEALAGNPPDTVSDVYTIGKLMEYLLDYMSPKDSQTISPLLYNLIQPDPANRIASVEMLRSNLFELSNQLGSRHLMKNIAVVGMSSGCGTTHVAISLVATLNHMGVDACYFEQNNTRALYSMYQVSSDMYEANGCFFQRDFKGYPKYGEGISFSYADAAFLIQDYGSADFAHFDLSCDLLICVISASPWKWNHLSELCSFLETYSGKVVLLCNLGDKSAARFLAKELGKPVHSYFYDEKPLLFSEAKSSFYKQLLKNEFCEELSLRKSKRSKRKDFT